MSSPTLTDVAVARPSSSSGSITLNEADDKASTFVLVQPKDKSLIRRWFNGVRRVGFHAGAQKQPEPSTSGKKPEESLAQTSPSRVSSDLVDVTQSPSRKDFAYVEPTTKVESPSADLSMSVPALTRVDFIAAPEEATVAPSVFSESIVLNDNKTMSTKPAKAKRSRKPRGPTMITPAVLERLAKDNKRHQGTVSAREAELRRNSSRGAGSSVSRASGVQASPMRWSQD